MSDDNEDVEAKVEKGALAEVPDLAEIPLPPGPVPVLQDTNTGNQVDKKKQEIAAATPPAGDDLLKHPGPFPKRPKGDPPPGLPPLDIMGFMSMLPPGVPLPDGLLPEMPEEEPQPPVQINKKKRNRQIGSWIEFFDDNNKPYYQHVETKEVQWETPKDFGGTDWVEYETEDKRKYYFNISTGITVWQKPTEMTPREKPQFIKELEAAEQKRMIAEKQRQRKADAHNAVSAIVELEIPLTEQQIKQNNKREADLREKFRKERQKRNEKGSLDYLPEELRAREEKRQKRRVARERNEKKQNVALQEQSKRRKVDDLKVCPTGGYLYYRYILTI